MLALSCLYKPVLVSLLVFLERLCGLSVYFFLFFCVARSPGIRAQAVTLFCGSGEGLAVLSTRDAPVGGVSLNTQTVLLVCFLVVAFCAIKCLLFCLETLWKNKFEVNSFFSLLCICLMWQTWTL